MKKIWTERNEARGASVKKSALNGTSEARVDVVYDWKHLADEASGKPGIVWVRVYKDRKRTYVSTGVRVLPSQWHDVYWVVRHEAAEVLNRQIREQMERCVEMTRPTSDGAALPSSKEMRMDRAEASLLDWMREQIATERLSEGTRDHHFSMLRTLEEWGKMKRFEDVTQANVRAFMRWIAGRKIVKLVDGKEELVLMAKPTVHDYWKRLGKWLRIARTEKLIARDALDGIKVEKGKSKVRVFLTDAELQALENVELKSEHLRMARDRFLVQCGTGVAYADLMSVDFSQRMTMNGHTVLVGAREKTDEQFFLVILPIAERVLERWGWRVPEICYNDYNEYVGIVATAAGIEKHITTHVGRHTYATQCLSHGVRLEAVQRTLGHSSIKTTEIYAHLVDEKVLSAFDKYE